jgi:pSer/pThr/pTyr-binding forkhead associated (FHA) protein
MPRLVKVASPSQEVSSTHIEVRQLGTSVVVTDMRSTNGSVVISPGAPPRKLRQGESVVVSPGSLVDIGDGNIMEILPLERKAPGHEPTHAETQPPERGPQ